MVTIPIDPFFDASVFGQYAVFKGYGSNATNIVVVFDQSFADTTIGGIQFEQHRLEALCRTEDVPNADNRATLNVCDRLTTSHGLMLTTSTGKELITTGLTHKVVNVAKDSTGITTLDLSLN